MSIHQNEQLYLFTGRVIMKTLSVRRASLELYILVLNVQTVGFNNYVKGRANVLGGPYFALPWYNLNPEHWTLTLPLWKTNPKRDTRNSFMLPLGLLPFNLTRYFCSTILLFHFRSESIFSPYLCKCIFFDIFIKNTLFILLWKTRTKIMQSFLLFCIYRAFQKLGEV